MAYTALAMTVRYLDSSYSLPASAEEVGGRLLSGVTNDALLPKFGNDGWMSAFTSAKSLILVCMLSTAYMCHFNAPKFYLELQNNTLPRFNSMVSIAFGISILLTGFITAIGFLTFGQASSGLILNNYAATDGLIQASRVAVAISLVFSYPLAFQGCRDGMLDLVNIPTPQRSNACLNITTIALLAILTFLASTLKDVSFVLAFGGATLGNALTYVYPAIMYYGVVKKQGRNENGEETVGLVVAGISAVLGVIMGAIGAKMAIQK